MNGTVTQFAPYIFFYGRCEEALNFYKGVFGGSYELQRHDNSPTVMHATFTAPGITFMASDGQATKSVDPNAGNISLAITFDSPDAGDGTFAALIEGGQAQMPLSPVPWGGRFGVAHDKFGNQWFVTAP